LNKIKFESAPEVAKLRK